MPGIEQRVRERLDLIASRDREINSFIRVDHDEALAAARLADASMAGTPRGLAGLTFAAKDNIAVEGKPCTAGVAAYRESIANADARVINRLRAAGSVLLGSTNLEEAALGAVTDNPAFGACMNPLAPGLTPGGSSGGSAAAVAAGFVDLALGSDTMGSVRLPAAYCGLYGLKPTFGLVGRTGLVPLARTLDTIGPISADPKLLWPALTALVGSDPNDPDQRDPPPGWWLRPRQPDLTGVAVGVPRQLSGIDFEPAVDASFARSVSVIRALEGRVHPVDLPSWDPARVSRAGLVVIEAQAAAAFPDLLEEDAAASPYLKGLLRWGRDVTAGRLVAAQALLETVSAEIHRAFGRVDAIALPATPQRAFAHGTEPPSNQTDLMPLASISGCPAVVLPAASEDHGLPSSLQIVARPWDEGRLTLWAERVAPELLS